MKHFSKIHVWPVAFNFQMKTKKLFFYPFTYTLQPNYPWKPFSWLCLFYYICCFKTRAVNFLMTAFMFHSISSGKWSCIFGFLTCNQEFTCLKKSFSATATPADNFLFRHVKSKLHVENLKLLHHYPNSKLIPN